MNDAAVHLAAAVAGAASVAAGVPFLARRLARAPHLRTNYRGRQVVGTAGVVLVLPLLVGGAAGSILQGDAGVVVGAVGAGVAMAVLGYVDDVYGDRHAGGFVGHIQALFEGRVTTGLLKAVGGGVVGLSAAALVGWRGPWIVVTGAAVALAANLANLLDLRPARSIKAWLPAAAVILWMSYPDPVAGVLAAVGGGALVFAVHEMGESVMLGDTGAGLLGAVAGVAAVSTVGRTGSLVLLGVLVGLTAVSEAISFSRVIDALAPLRWLDRLGRRA